MPESRGQSSQGQGFLLHLGQAVRARRLGDAGLVEARLAGRALLKSLTALREEEPTVIIDLSNDRLSCRGAFVATEAAPDLARPLANQGLSSIEFGPAADHATIGSFIDVLAQSEDGEAAVGLWKEDLPGIHWESDFVGLLANAPDARGIKALADGIAASLETSTPRSRPQSRSQPPTTDPELKRRKDEILADTGAPLLQAGVPVMLRALDSPEARERLGVDGVVRVLEASLSGLEEQGAVAQLEAVAGWIASVLTAPEGEHPFENVVRGVAARTLEQRSARPQAAAAVTDALGAVAVELLCERLGRAKGGAVARTLCALAAIDLAPVEAYGEAHPELRLEALEALGAATGDAAAPLAWRWFNSLDLQTLPSDQQGRAIAALTRVVPEEQALAWLDQLLSRKPLLGRKAHRAIQLAGVHTLDQWPAEGATEVLGEHRTRTDKIVSGAIDKALSRR